MKYYKLKKDLPTFKSGDNFVLADDGCLYLLNTTPPHWKKQVMAYHANTLEKFPNILTDWFEQIADPVIKTPHFNRAFNNSEVLVWTLFGGSGGEFFTMSSDNGEGKPVFTIKPTGHSGGMFGGDYHYNVTINWDSLGKFFDAIDPERE